MNDDYNLCNIPFFNDQNDMNFEDFRIMNPQSISQLPVSKDQGQVVFQQPHDQMQVQEVDMFEIFQLKQNLNNISRSVKRIEQLIQEQFNQQQSNLKKKQLFWTLEEHHTFLKLVSKFGRQNLKDIAKNMSQLRNLQQVRTHAQKYFDKLDKLKIDGQILAEQQNAQLSPVISANISFLGSLLHQNQLQEHQILLLIQNNPLQYIHVLLDQKIASQLIPLSLVCVSNAQKVLRNVYSDIPFGSYFVANGLDTQSQLFCAISGQYQQQNQQNYSTSAFINVIYNKAPDLLIDRSVPQHKFTTSSMFFDIDQIEFIQLNINVFLKYCCAYITSQLFNKQFLYDFLYSIILCFSQIQQINDPFDYVLQRISEQINRTIEDVCCYLFCFTCMLAHKIMVKN